MSRPVIRLGSDTLRQQQPKLAEHGWPDLLTMRVRESNGESPAQESRS